MLSMDQLHILKRSFTNVLFFRKLLKNMVRSSTLHFRGALEAPGLTEDHRYLHYRAVSAARASGKSVWLMADSRLHSRDFWLRVAELLDSAGYPCDVHEVADDVAVELALVELRETLRLEPRRWGLVLLGTQAEGTLPDAEAAATAGARVLYLDAVVPASSFAQIYGASSFGHGGVATVREELVSQVEAFVHLLSAERQPLTATVLLAGGPTEAALAARLSDALKDRGVVAASTIVNDSAELCSSFDDRAWLLVVARSQEQLTAEDRAYVHSRARRWRQHLEARPQKRHATSLREEVLQSAEHLTEGPSGVSCVFTDGGRAPRGAWLARPENVVAAALPALDTRALGQAARPQVLLLGADETLRSELASVAHVTSDEQMMTVPHFIVYADDASLQRRAEVAARFPDAAAFSVTDDSAPGVMSVGRYPQGGSATVAGLVAHHVVWQHTPGARAETCSFLYEGQTEKARPLGQKLARVLRPVAHKILETQRGRAEGSSVYLLSGPLTELADAFRQRSKEARAGSVPLPIAVCSSFLTSSQAIALKSSARGAQVFAPMAADVVARLGAIMRLYGLAPHEEREVDEIYRAS
jgi:hypothetical protein